MESLLLVAGSALWLGFLTSISPCPLATNIAAIAYVGKTVDRPGQVLLAGLLYTLGRTVGYLAVALVVVKSLLSISSVSLFLQRNLNQALGPVLLLVGLLLIDVIPWPWTGNGSALFDRLQTKVQRLGLWGAGLLGLVFALTFCPVSAALFFGSLVPLAVSHQSAILLPSIFGVGTAVPVVFCSLVLAFAANRISKAFNALTLIERWMRRVTALVFIGIGGYYLLSYTFEVL
ncbi:MAG TPA: cytochrome C biogenesis protein [Myxococcales bacterium]|jgi:cytochrome c biogenesis protein CcdA|nr:cytochrome C biogenesis protein [Myxococcales bacterium]